MDKRYRWRTLKHNSFQSVNLWFILTMRIFPRISDDNVDQRSGGINSSPGEKLIKK